MAAATAARRSRRCRGSSTPCASAATGSRPSAACSASPWSGSRSARAGDLTEPSRLVKPPVFLDSAIDVLDHSGATKHLEVADTVWQLALLDAACWGWPLVQRVFPEARSRKVKRGQPVVLDLADRQSVPGVEVQTERHLV